MMHVLVSSGTIQTPPVPMSEVLQNPRLVGYWCILFYKWVGQDSICPMSYFQSKSYQLNNHNIQAL